MKVHAILLKPLDGAAPGTPRSFDKNDFDRLKAMGAVRKARDEDAVEDPVDEQALLLEQFRHPVDGPRILAEMKSAFESLGRDRDRIKGELGDVIAARDTAIDEAKAAIAERDEARTALTMAHGERDAARSGIETLQAAHDAGQAELSILRASQPETVRAKAK